MKDYTFNGQRDGEEVLEIVHSHPYILYPKIMKLLLLILIAIVLLLFLLKFQPIALYITIASILLIAFSSFGVARAIFCFNESVFIITNQRVFLIEQKGFFARKIAEVDLYKIIDMYSETKGFTRTLLKYGDLHIRTAGAQEGGDIVLADVPNPYSVQQRIAKIALDNPEPKKTPNIIR